MGEWHTNSTSIIVQIYTIDIYGTIYYVANFVDNTAFSQVSGLWKALSSYIMKETRQKVNKPKALLARKIKQNLVFCLFKVNPA